MGNALDDNIGTGRFFGLLDGIYRSKYANYVGLFREKSSLLPPPSKKGDYIYSGYGNDTISASKYNDWLYGGQGADFLNGGDGYDVAGLERVANYDINLTIHPAYTGTWPLGIHGIELSAEYSELNGDKLFNIELLQLGNGDDWVIVDNVDGEELSRMTIDLSYGEDAVSFTTESVLINTVLGDNRATIFNFLERLLPVLVRTSSIDRVVKELIDLYNKDIVIQAEIDSARASNTPFNDDRNGIEFRNVEKFFLSDEDDEFYLYLDASPDTREVHGGGGEDIILIAGSGSASFTADGGADDDWVLAKDGQKIITAGGPGRDWIFNRSKSGVVFGDTIDGLDPKTGKPIADSSENADNFWWAPGVTIMDAQKHDVLKYYGFPLVGGTQSLPTTVLGQTGLLALPSSLYVGNMAGYKAGQALKSEGSLFFDNFLTSIIYVYRKDTGSLYVANHLPGFLELVGGGDLANKMKDLGQLGSMAVRKFDAQGSFWGLAFKGMETMLLGDLGMAFRLANPFLAVMALLPPVLGGLNKLIPLVDKIVYFAYAAARVAKAALWATGVDPLIIDLEGDGLESIALDDSDAWFDIDGDGFFERTGWLSDREGFLVRDLNHNGRIDNLSEMFGTAEQTGFSVLATYDANADGRIDAQDEVWETLLIWQDANADGKTDDGELHPLSDFGIESFSLEEQRLDHETPQGTQLLSRAAVHLADGETVPAYSAVFEVSEEETRFAGESGRAFWMAADAPDMRGYGNVPNLQVAMSNDPAFAGVVQSVLPHLTVPDLKDLHAAAGPILDVWGQILASSRELMPVLVEHDADGAEVLLDRAVYVEDDAGGYWARASGEPVLDANGAEIARPKLGDILAQPAQGGEEWRLEQAFSPHDRAKPVQHREGYLYLAERTDDDRVVVHDVAMPDDSGVWHRLSGEAVTDAAGNVIAAPGREDVLRMPRPEGMEWRSEELGWNPYADLPVERIGVRQVDGRIVDYTVKVTDEAGSFYVWARNLDRALELQFKTGGAPNVDLRNFAIDFDRLDELNSTLDSHQRVETLTPGQFQFALALVGVAFEPQMLTAAVGVDGVIHYAVNDEGDYSLDSETYASGIEVMVRLLDVVVPEYFTIARQIAVSLAFQSGLRDFARDLVYDVESDAWYSDGDRQLAPLFEAIFEAMPADEASAETYLERWSEILWHFYPQFRTGSKYDPLSHTLSVDQAYVFQMLLPAYETVGGPLNLETVLHALGVDQTRLVAVDAGSTETHGTDGTDYFYIHDIGNDHVYSGGWGKDLYFVGQNVGDVRIINQDREGADELRLSHLVADDILPTRVGEDLILTLEDGSGSIRIVDQFLGEYNPVLTTGEQLNSGVDKIVFADGFVWDRKSLALLVADPRETSDPYIGSGSGDVLWGGKGNDTLRGRAGGDTYIFARGDGQDVIFEEGNASFGPLKAGIDFLVFKGDIGPEDVKLTRVGDSNDLNIVLLDEQGNETEDRITIRDQFGGMRLNMESFGLIDPGLGLKYISLNQVERIVFSEGASLDVPAMITRVLENARTDGDDAIYGFITNDTLDGGPGDDWLTGRGGGDTYIFGKGYGHDVIRDDDTRSLKLFGDGDPDILKFTDVLWTDLAFEREGDSDTLTLRIRETGDAVTIQDFTEQLLLVGYMNRIERIEFGDGTRWSWLKLLQHYVDVARTDSDDVIYGFSVSDVLDGGPGDDRLEGGAGNDFYIYRRGEGSDTIFDLSPEDVNDDFFHVYSPTDNDRLRLEGISFNDVEVSRTDEDLIFTIRETGERITIEDQFVRAGGQRSAIENFEFDDVTVRFTQLNAEDVDVVGTAGDDVLRGSNLSETLDGRGGDDTLIGRDGGDIYVFDAGYGEDVIIDRKERAAWPDRKGMVVPEDDVVRFGPHIGRDDVIFTRDGDDLLVTLQGRPDSLRIKDQFADLINGVERFEFADGSYLSIEDVEQILQITGGNRGDNVLIGAPDHRNSLDGRQGDDELHGGRLDDSYAFGFGYDFDTIHEQPDEAGVVDRVVFGATVRFEDLKLMRRGADLVIDLGNGEDVLTIVGGLGNTRIEEFHFADGRIVGIDELMDELLRGSDADERLVGFDDRDDVLDGRGGSDALIGGTGDDTYHFGYGSGSDSIEESGGEDTLIINAGIGMFISISSMTICWSPCKAVTTGW